MSVAPLLFLDFDGVLHPTSATPERHFCQIQLLADSLSDSDCRLVISSSWRHHHALPDLIERFPASLRHRFVGATGGPCFGRWPRYQEILVFVSRASAGAEWRALDDSWNEFPPACPKLIVCDPNRGIAARQADALRSWLRR